MGLAHPLLASPAFKLPGPSSAHPGMGTWNSVGHLTSLDEAQVCPEEASLRPVAWAYAWVLPLLSSDLSWSFLDPFPLLLFCLIH